MSSNPLSDAVTPDFGTMFELLSSRQSRQILRALERPMTAAEVADTCEMPRSTAYQKLQAMADAGLLRKQEQDDAARYAIDFEAVVVRRAEGELELDLTDTSRSAAEQLSVLWEEVRSEAGRE